MDNEDLLEMPSDVEAAITAEPVTATVKELATEYHSINLKYKKQTKELEETKSARAKLGHRLYSLMLAEGNPSARFTGLGLFSAFQTANAIQIEDDAKVEAFLAAHPELAHFYQKRIDKSLIGDMVKFLRERRVDPEGKEIPNPLPKDLSEIGITETFRETVSVKK